MSIHTLTQHVESGTPFQVTFGYTHMNNISTKKVRYVIVSKDMHVAYTAV